ncbi:anti-sigma factor [Sphingobacterium corticibacterium]|uniref:Anti-sigma factor n=1 Tax=Sphingobacterium corticibacterium TaxID=2484746 RepID=A0A4Q6XYI5_9SPHI|nr:anti-sigma factor [Sphingobacterium corticibacterium]RZF62504.1 anti-sigma factor [Sphingobacterium corticibacterium]
MDIREYISSGIIEAYVLGLATEQEASLLACVRKSYPEVEQAIVEAEVALEAMATAQAVRPAEHLKDDIWNRINTVSNVLPASQAEVTLEQEPESAPFLNKSTSKLKPRSRSLLAAAGLLLAMSVAINIYMYRDNRAAQQDLVAVNAQKEQAEKLLSSSAAQWEIINKPAVRSILLEGTPDHSDLRARVYWNTEEKSVYLIADQLPPAPEGKQYQLWAIVDGNPVDAGLVPLSETQTMYTMRAIPSAEAFAITIEKIGGSAVPTLTELRVIGNI